MLRQVDYSSHNVRGKTIHAASLDYDCVRLVFTDGTFVNAVLTDHEGGYCRDGGMHNEEITVHSNLDGGYTNPHEAWNLHGQGIITQDEYTEFCKLYESQQKAKDAEREEKERAEYNRLRKVYGNR